MNLYYLKDFNELLDKTSISYCLLKVVLTSKGRNKNVLPNVAFGMSMIFSLASEKEKKKAQERIFMFLLTLEEDETNDVLK